MPTKAFLLTPQPWACAAVLLMTVGFFTGANTFATVVIAPNDLVNQDGNTVPASQTYGDTSNLFPFFPGAGNPLEYQQVYDASQFSSFAVGGENITEISFRVGIEATERTDGGAFAATIPLIQISLSTTSSTPAGLSSSVPNNYPGDPNAPPAGADATFAHNVGSDAVTVYGVPGVGSPLAVASTGATTTGTSTANPAPFDITIVLTTPFHYDPSQGNLLLNVVNYEGAASPTGIQLDGTMAEDSVASVYNYGSATGATATGSSTEGLVTEFNTGALVPEPGAARAHPGLLSPDDCPLALPPPPTARFPPMKSPRHPLSRREFLRLTAAAGGAAALGGATADLARAGLPGFKIGPVAPSPIGVTTPVPPLPAPSLSGIQHVVVVMMENRSFDHFLGWLPGANGLQAGLTYYDSAGLPHVTAPLAPDYQGCSLTDPNHSYEGGRVEYNGSITSTNGPCNGFRFAGANPDDNFSIGYYQQSDLAFFGQAAPALDRVRQLFRRHHGRNVSEPFPHARRPDRSAA